MWKMICLLGTTLALNAVMAHPPTEHSTDFRTANAAQPGMPGLEAPAARALNMSGAGPTSLSQPQRWIF